MSQEIFEEWKKLAGRARVDTKAANELYEQEGRQLLETIDTDPQLSQGWDSTYLLSNDILSDLIQKLPVNKEASILDLGSGANPRLFLGLSARLKNKTMRYIAADISVSKLKAFNAVVRKKGIQLRHIFTCLDCARIPFKNGAFDFVVCDDTIEHLTDPERSLLEISRILKQDGLLILSTPNRRRADVLIRRALDFIRRKKTCRRDYYMAVSHLIEFTHAELRKMLLSSGLAIRKTFVLSYPFSLPEIKKAGYFSGIPDLLLAFPYALLNSFILLAGNKTLSTHIFLLCAKKK